MPRAIVIGGSVAGLFAARFLRQDGWDVLVCERNTEELSGRGAGIVTHPELLDLLDRAGVPARGRIGIDVPVRRMLDHTGRVVEEIPLAQTMTSWELVFRRLRDNLPGIAYRLGCPLEAVTQHDLTVEARFADGTVEPCDLLVGADGIWSSVRAAVAPEAQPAYAGYVAWRCLIEERRIDPAAQPQCFDSFAFELNDRGEILGYPVAGENEAMDPGQRRYNVVWYRLADADTTLPWLLTDRNGKRHELSIPPPLIAPAVLDNLREGAAAELSPFFAGLVRGADRPFLQPIFDLTVPRMAKGRACILGDAASVARPHVGAGVTKAAQDAACLADCLRESASIEAGLAAFDRTRRAVNNIIVARAQELGEAGWRHDLSTVLRETATLDFLRASTHA